MPSRSCVTLVPDKTALMVWLKACELMPSARARSWSTSTRTTFEGSFQSKLMLRAFGVLPSTDAKLVGQLAHFRRIWSADAELQRPTDWGSKLERAHARQHLLELRPLQRGEDALLHAGRGP